MIQRTFCNCVCIESWDGHISTCALVPSCPFWAGLYKERTNKVISVPGESREQNRTRFPLAVTFHQHQVERARSLADVRCALKIFNASLSEQ